MKLVIVESPAKAKTIAKYLGADYVVDASKGHIRDLPEKEMGVDIEKNYQPVYRIRTKEQKETIARLKEKVEKAEQVFLATDPDREGEAISWHLQQALGLDPKAKNRIMFNEISKKAVNEAIKTPAYVDMQLVDAQQARRVLDRLVGYTLSPVLCRKIQGKLSAGRVQSAALRILVDREREIRNFVPEEYWSISANLHKSKCPPDFKATLSEKNGKKVKIENKQQCDDVVNAVTGAEWVVSNVKKSKTQSKPQPPFTTSTLQQDAINKLGMSSSEVMKVAQQLYEGFNIEGIGHVALVTYIRTDSVRVSDQAIYAARNLIESKYGTEYLPKYPNNFANKNQAQDAHEAIRPINLDLTPDMLKDKLQKNQYLLYKLIYDKFVASQATNAIYNNTTVKIDADIYTFTATGKVMEFAGWTVIYSENKKEKSEDGENARMPALEVGDVLKLVKLNHEQKFTKPPQRYSEASIIKVLEERGIGRPSTYSTIMQTLNKRDYVTKEKKFLVPTELGELVVDFLLQHFSQIVDVEFTAEMEGKLDSIAEKGEIWHKVVDDFYKPLNNQVSVALKGEKMYMPDQPSDETCELCGAPMVYKTGKFGKYLACTNYPSCKNHRSLKEKSAPKKTEEVCSICGAPMLEREGKFGKYLACSNYPNCKNTISLNAPKQAAPEVVAKCPICGKDVVKRLTKRGKEFFGCTGYPTCQFASWDIPTGKKCPNCNEHLVYKQDAKGNKTITCSSKTCNYVEMCND